MFKLNTKEDKFYVNFQKQSEIILEATKELDIFVDSLESNNAYSQVIQELEHKADQVVHTIIEDLNNSFVTPIDREDIYHITKRMDDIIDNIESVVHRFIMFNIDKANEETKIFINFLKKCVEEIVQLMKVLPMMSKETARKIIRDKVISVNKIENEADIFFREIISKMFRAENIDPLEVVKWKDIYQRFENTIDSCEDVVNIIEGVVMKHA
ncbi:DUF47 family protein [uncultured Clostridium sp.]|jgi:hypothetical protein|uniref:DUF47 domain-containing protein n=1 Tax=uncultured Clostridium sp. TaxID=59620 RepID=UPI002627E73E|nr:DUF47 family protein [uncultured Clostridium sp.]